MRGTTITECWAVRCGSKTKEANTTGPEPPTPGVWAWPVESASPPAIAALRVSWHTRWATPSWIRTSGSLGTPSASNARGRVAGMRGVSARLIAEAATRVPSRPLNAPRPSACAWPSQASAPRNSSSSPTASGASTTG